MLVLLLVTVVFGLLGVPAVAAAAPGDLDASFGSGGVRSLASGTQLFGVAVQSDREVVAVGSSGSSLLVERFSAVGAPEGAFAAGGGVGRAVVVQPDGKIVVAGNDGAGMLVERFNANGSRDGGFGSGGVEGGGGGGGVGGLTQRAAVMVVLARGGWCMPFLAGARTRWRLALTGRSSRLGRCLGWARFGGVRGGSCRPMG